VMADYMFFLKNVLMVSLAMNMGLIWKISYYDDEENLTSRWGNIQQKLQFHGVYFNAQKSNRIIEQQQDDEAHVSKRTQMLASLETVVINFDQ